MRDDEPVGSENQAAAEAQTAGDGTPGDLAGTTSSGDLDVHGDPQPVDPIDEAKDYADRSIEVVTSAAVRAHDLTAEHARRFLRALKDAVERVERAVEHHDDAGA
jgi:hypothetical protein